jgi:hypothetical protein|tara:strand:+ start:4950 stop:5165 length:216 start_codon:yes stop_codon:yes gene_type:complete
MNFKKITPYLLSGIGLGFAYAIIDEGGLLNAFGRYSIDETISWIVGGGLAGTVIGYWRTVGGGEEEEESSQ